jgi:hypothetical protein
MLFGGTGIKDAVADGCVALINSSGISISSIGTSWSSLILLVSVISAFPLFLSSLAFRAPCLVDDSTNLLRLCRSSYGLHLEKTLA